MVGSQLGIALNILLSELELVVLLIIVLVPITAQMFAKACVLYKKETIVQEANDEVKSYLEQDDDFFSSASTPLFTPNKRNMTPLKTLITSRLNTQPNDEDDLYTYIKVHKQLHRKRSLMLSICEIDDNLFIQQDFSVKS